MGLPEAGGPSVKPYLASYLTETRAVRHELLGRHFVAHATHVPHKRGRLTPSHWYVVADSFITRVTREEAALRLLNYLETMTPADFWNLLDHEEANWVHDEFLDHMARCQPMYGSCALPNGHKGPHDAHTKDFFPEVLI
jgi:hypothetical protein